MFISAQIAVTAAGDVLAPTNVSAQTEQVLSNIELILAEVGATLENVASTTVYLASLDHYADFDKAYARRFGTHKPARAVVQAGLVRPGIVVAIQAIASLPTKGA